MNLKSYTRGIGAGLIVASLVLGIGAKTEKMSDAQVVERAKELGLIEAQTLTQISAETSISKEDTSETVSISKEEPAPEFKEKDEVTVDPILPETEGSVSTGSDETEVSTTVSEDTQAETSTEISDETSTESSVSTEPEAEENPGFVSDENAVEITVARGDSSVTVARRLYEAGLVDSAVELDKYLCSNGYDRRICVGTYRISYGATFEEIAKIITRK